MDKHATGTITEAAPRGLTDNHQPASKSRVPPDRIIRERECEQKTGTSRSTRWRLEREGGFPKRGRISPGCVGWLESEINDWIAAKFDLEAAPNDLEAAPNDLEAAPSPEIIEPRPHFNTEAAATVRPRRRRQPAPRASPIKEIRAP
jgi:prophage regulatory protein